jgi:hypothetical protein
MVEVALSALWEEPVRMRQDDVPDFVPKFLDLFPKLPDFVSDLALKFPDLVPKLLDLTCKRRMAYHVSSPC